VPLHRALTVRQPWANLIAAGEKSIEIRKWTTDYRGPLVICAAKAVDPDAMPMLRIEPRGCVLCRVTLVDVRPLKRADWSVACLPRALIDTSMFAFVLESPEFLEPLPVSGALGLFGILDQFVVPV
jgi:hypothetical protein